VPRVGCSSPSLARSEPSRRLESFQRGGLGRGLRPAHPLVHRGHSQHHRMCRHGFPAVTSGALGPKPTVDSSTQKLPLVQSRWIGASRARSRRARLGLWSRYSLPTKRLPGFMRNLHLFIYTTPWFARQQTSVLRDFFQNMYRHAPEVSTVFCRLH
jgi:hypothetical protein